MTEAAAHFALEIAIGRLDLLLERNSVSDAAEIWLLLGEIWGAGS